MNKKRVAILLLALLGFILTIKLAHIYYIANYQRYSLASFCSINEFIDCDGAARTTTSQFWGIPLAYWGMLFYITVIFLTFVDKLKHIKFLRFLEVFKNPNDYIITLGTIAFSISMILAGISIFKIHKLCILCVFTYIIDLIIALTAASAKFSNIVTAFIATVIDFIDGAKKYTKTFIVLLIFAISFLSYSQTTYNFIPHAKKHKELMKYSNIKKNPYRISGNTLGNDKGDVVIELYSDYVCPMCYIQNIMLHKAVKEFKNIKIIHHNFPFDKECNPFININMHPNACFMAKGAIAARKQGNYWGMASLLYENQPKNTKNLLKLAKTLKFDEEQFLKDFASAETSAEIETELKNANLKDIDSTPTMIINGDKIVGIKPYKDLEKELINYGAKRK